MHTPQPSHAFLQFLPARLRKARRRLSEMIWSVDSDPLPVQQTTPTHDHRPISEVDSSEFSSVEELPHYWGGGFDQCWWKVQIPAAEDGQPRYLSWQDQGEATAYINGKPWYGIGPGHEYTPLPDGAVELWIDSTCMRTGIWVPGAKQGIHPKGSEFNGAFIAHRNDEAWYAHHKLDVLIELAALIYKRSNPGKDDLFSHRLYREPVDVAEPIVRRILARGNEAIDALDHHGPAACNTRLDALLEDLKGAADDHTVILTGHAHVDLVWLWPERAGDAKAVHSFANAVRTIERYPEVKFGYSQAASYQAVARRAPAILDDVKELIKQGKWEAYGAMWVESDTQLPCGEALVRAFELGQAGFRDLCGEESPIVWLPDVFGYSGVIPSIMSGFGIPYFYTTKLHWSTSVKFPFSSFRWRGNDGSEVLGHISWHPYNQRCTPDELRENTDNFRQAGLTDESLMPTGYGDGGGGVTDDMCERARILADLSGLPKTRWGRVTDYFDHLAGVETRLPVWRGEMYLEFHRGVQTTRGDLKLAFRQTESALQMWEAAHVAKGLGPIDREPWERICFAQFHDYIPGSSIDAVYREHVPELQALVERCRTEATRALGGSESTDALFNPLPMERTWEHNGARYTLPPLTGVKLKDAKKADDSEVKVEPRRITTDRLDVAFDDAGRITEFNVDGQAIPLEAPAAQLVTYPDHPAVYPAWDVDRPTVDNGREITAPAEITVEDDALVVQQQLSEKSSAKLRFRAAAGEPYLRIDIEVDMQDTETLVQFQVPTKLMGRQARFGAPFGSALRASALGTLEQDARFECPGSRWATMADDTESFGVMLITEAKYGFGASEGRLHVSLLRTAAHTGNGGGGPDPDAAPKGQRFSDLGHHQIRLLLGGYSANAPRHENPAALADTAFTPAIPYTGDAVDCGLLGLDGGDSLVPAWAKPLSADRWVLRLHETMGRRGNAQLRLASGVTATPVDLKDQPIGEPITEIAFEPYQIKSVLIQR